MSDGNGLVSADGLRQFRFPSPKKGIDPNTLEPYSKTGIQVNFESRPIAEGKFINNLHLGVCNDSKIKLEIASISSPDIDFSGDVIRPDSVFVLSTTLEAS